MTSVLAKVNMEAIDFVFIKEGNTIKEVLFMFVEPSEDILVTLPHPVKDCIFAYWAAKELLFSREEIYSIN